MNKIKWPDFPTIKLQDIPKASTLIHCGGNKITEWAGNDVYQFPYFPAPYHASLYKERGIALNVGKFKTLMEVDTECRSNRAIYVIVYKELTAEDREMICHEADVDADDPKLGINWSTYGFTDFLRFGFRDTALAYYKRKWGKFPAWLIKTAGKCVPSSNKDICSENVVLLFEKKEIQVSAQIPSATAPWDLVLFAEQNPHLCAIYLLHMGEDYKKKYLS